MAKLAMRKLNLDQALSGREKLFFVIAAAGVLLFFVNWLLSPIGSKITMQKAEMKNIEIQVDGLQKLIEGLKTQGVSQAPEPRKEMPLDDRTKRMLDRKVIDPLTEVHSTVELLNNRRVAKGVKIDDIKVGNMVEKDAYSMVPLSINFEGRYGAVQGYFSSLEGFDRPLFVRRFQLKSVQETGGGGAVNASAEVDLYIVKR